MDEFRRPLGVLIAAVVVWVIALAVNNGSDRGSQGAMLIGTLAVFAALGSLGVIVWRLVRGRRAPSA